MKKVLFLIITVLSLIFYSCDDNKPTFTRASIISEDFVKAKMNYPAEVEFDGDRRGSESSPNEYDVYQKFTAKNAFGVKSSYVYKIHMIYKGGDWADMSNWSHGLLTIENLSTGEQLRFHGNAYDSMQKRNVEKKENADSQITDSLVKVIKGE